MIDDLRSADLLDGWSFVIALVFIGVYFYYQAIDGRGRPCPQCGNRVKPNVTVCPTCKHSFVTQPVVQPEVLAALKPPDDLAEGWKADPLKPEKLRWWDGQAWTARVGVRASG